MSSAPTKNTIIAHIVNTEGGYVDDPSDRGGATKYGITEAVARQYGYKGDMRDLPLDTATEIYDKKYWQSFKGDQVYDESWRLAAVLMDFAVNSGVNRAVRELQQTLNALNNQAQDYADIAVDGAMGSATLMAISSLARVRGDAGLNVLAATVDCCRVSFLRSISLSTPADQRFTYGWFLRSLRLLETLQ